jgi:hypothetical protein
MFGIHPWDVWRLSASEIRQYLWFIEQQVTRKR